MWIVFITTYPPRECGLATFSSDLIDSFDEIFSPREETKVIAMEVDNSPVDEKYSSKVIYKVSENKKEDYVDAAKYLNGLSQVKIVSIQHEFGIFGQNDGENILHFLDEIKKPVSVTYHTVLPKPSEHILEIVKKISDRANTLIVMTHNAKMLLETVYGIPSAKIKIIPHGIHAMSYTDSLDAKKEISKKYKAVNLKDKKVVSTFGLLNRGKGIEFAIEALPAIVREFPEIHYLVIGATHPVVLRREGPVYINELRKKAEELGVGDHITFYDSYFKTPTLLKFLKATDVYLSLSQNPDQAVSGTLTYALGCGRPVISTPFMQAKEVITDEVGKLVEFNNSSSISDAVVSLFKNEGDLKSKSHAAYFRTRGMVWPNIALSYMAEFIAISPELAKKEKALPHVSLEHFERMTDDFGMFQFAVLTEPNKSSGYTLDDNARALIAVVWEFDKNKKEDNISKHKRVEAKLLEVYVSFLEKAVKKEGGFINYFNGDREEDRPRNTQENLEDSNARALWAIAELYKSKVPEEMKLRAFELFTNQVKNHKRVSSPRAAAIFIKAFSIWVSAQSANGDAGKDTDKNLRQELIAHITFYADFLMSILKDNEMEGWHWFEDAMTYSNAILPEALFIAHKFTGYEHYLEAGKRTLDFLIGHSFEGDICVPIGQAGWFRRGGAKEPFDQQPEEVSALILALHTAAVISGDDGKENNVHEKYMNCIHSAFTWFLGNNVLGQVIYSHETGGCYDGLGDQHINLNQGAESTVSYLLARLVIERKGV